jgi:hypothetical protein
MEQTARDSNFAEIRSILNQIERLVRSGQESHAANLIEEALSGSDHQLLLFLRSNELWGGAGSIADQAGVDHPQYTAQIEELVIRLGRVQMRAGVINVRTQGWVETFESWRPLRQKSDAR